MKRKKRKGRVGSLYHAPIITAMPLFSFLDALRNVDEFTIFPAEKTVGRLSSIARNLVGNRLRLSFD